jgi:hypothetical protein
MTGGEDHSYGLIVLGLQHDGVLADDQSDGLLSRLVEE